MTKGGAQTPIDGMEMGRRLEYRNNATKFMVLVTDEGYYIDNRYGITSLKNMVNLLSSDDIITSVVTKSYLQSTYSIFYERTQGAYFSIDTYFAPQLKEFILAYIQNQDAFRGVTSTGLTSTTLDSPLAREGLTDTDSDALTDSEEVNWEMITIHDNGEYTLPTLEDCMMEKKGYVEAGLDRLAAIHRERALKNSILPLLSELQEPIC